MDAANDGPSSDAADIKPRFRVRDRDSMNRHFDLWSYADVRTHSAAILERVQDGSVPSDGAWPSEQVQASRSRVDSGMAP